VVFFENFNISLVYDYIGENNKASRIFTAATVKRNLLFLKTVGMTSTKKSHPLGNNIDLFSCAIAYLWGRSSWCMSSLFLKLTLMPILSYVLGDYSYPFI
jgi:hypothetical protein